MGTGEQDGFDLPPGTHEEPEPEPVPKKPHVSHNSGEVEWYTPRMYIKPVREVLGGIDLDPASCRTAQDVIKAARYYTKEDDGLSKEWAGRVFLNPPYANRLVVPFVSKLCSHVERGDVEAAILLVNNGGDSRWCQRALWLSQAVCHPLGRLKFEGRHKSSPTQGQYFLYYGPHTDKFLRTFGHFGWVGRTAHDAKPRDVVIDGFDLDSLLPRRWDGQG
jgi:DNA N-6-adenine-methyltransferase (Dam)